MLAAILQLREEVGKKRRRARTTILQIMFKHVKTVPIYKVAKEFGIQVTAAGKGICPSCGSESFTLKEKSFRCFRCGEGGDSINLLVVSGVAGSIGDAANLIAKRFNLDVKLKSMQREESQREKLLSIAFKAFNEEMLKGDEQALGYYIKRGWSPECVSNGEVGFCPDTNYLRTKLQFSSDEIEACGLSSTYSDWEYMRNRIVFPVIKGGKIKHLQGRSVNKDSELRWVASKGNPPISQYLYNADCLLKNATYKEAFLCEGISDAFSIRQLGDIPVVGSFGINFPSSLLTQSLGTKVRKLYAVFDNDKYPVGSLKDGEYKSWSATVEPLVEFSARTGTPVYCFMGTNNPNDDINSILLRNGYNREKFMYTIKSRSIPLPQMAYSICKNRKEHLIWMSLSVKYEEGELSEVLSRLDMSALSIGRIFASTLK